MDLYYGVRLTEVLTAVYAQGRTDGAVEAFDRFHLDLADAKKAIATLGSSSCSMVARPLIPATGGLLRDRLDSGAAEAARMMCALVVVLSPVRVNVRTFERRSGEAGRGVHSPGILRG